MKCGIGKELRLALWPLASRAWSCHYLINSCQLQANLKFAHPSEMPCNCFTDSPLLPAPVEKAPELSQQAVLENRPTCNRSGNIVWLNRRQSKAKKKKWEQTKNRSQLFLQFFRHGRLTAKVLLERKKRKKKKKALTSNGCDRKLLALERLTKNSTAPGKIEPLRLCVVLASMHMMNSVTSSRGAA